MSEIWLHMHNSRTEFRFVKLRRLIVTVHGICFFRSEAIELSLVNYFLFWMNIGHIFSNNACGHHNMMHALPYQK